MNILPPIRSAVALRIIPRMGRNGPFTVPLTVYGSTEVVILNYAEIRNRHFVVTRANADIRLGMRVERG